MDCTLLRGEVSIDSGASGLSSSIWKNPSPPRPYCRLKNIISKVLSVSLLNCYRKRNLLWSFLFNLCARCHHRWWAFCFCSLLHFSKQGWAARRRPCRKWFVPVFAHFLNYEHILHTWSQFTYLWTSLRFPLAWYFSLIVSREQEHFNRYSNFLATRILS